jgi:uncharacterized delta-60 repeat protein
MLPNLRTALPLALAGVLSTGAMAQPGSLDPAFATAGKYVQDFGFQDNLTKVRVQPWDQKIVAVGTAITPAFAGKLLVLRLLPGGSPDPGFGTNGSLIVTAFNESYAYDLAFTDDQKIVVVGARADNAFQFSMLVMRLNSDGTLDNGFGAAGFSEPEISTGDDFAYAVAPIAGGQLLLAGQALDSEFRNQPVVVRMNADGTVDGTFGTGGVAALPVTEADNNFWSIGVQSSGRIIAAGHIDQGLTGTGQFNQDVLVAAFTPDGQPDAAFGSGGVVVKPVSAEYNERAFGMAIAADDAIILAGYTTQPDFSFDAIVLKVDADGADATGFGTNGLVVFDNAVQDVFHGVALQPDGKVLACGTTGGFFFDPRDQLVVRFTPAGALDDGFSSDGFALDNVAGNFDEANAIALQADGRIVTAGKANTANLNDATVFRYLNDIGTMINGPATDDGLVIYPNPAQAGGFIAIALTGGAEHDAIVRLLDARGAEVMAPRRLSGLMPWKAIELPGHLAVGVYTIHLTEGSGRAWTARLLVQD